MDCGKQRKDWEYLGVIPYGKQDITQDDIDAVVNVLKSDFLTQGPCVPAFEKAISKYCGAKYAVAVTSATSALHLACLSLDLGHDDWLWTSPVTFVASANCGLYCGAKVDFVDIDPSTYNLCPKALKKKLVKAKKLGILPKIVVPVHLCGQPCDMKAIHALAEEYGFIGSLGLLLIYIIIIYRVIKIGSNSKSFFAKLFCFGYGSSIFFYVIVNMSMVLGLLPIVGSPLPIMSYGGSSLLATMIGFAIVFSAGIYQNQSIA